MKWIILLLGIASNASASVLIKLAMVPAQRSLSFSNPWALLSNWPFWLGLALYGAALALYVLALARLPLNVAHPILTSGAVGSVALLSVIIFKEPMPWTTIAGIACVIAGVVLITARV